MSWSSLWVPNHKYISFFIVYHSWNWKRLQNNQYVNTNTEHSLLSITSAATAMSCLLDTEGFFLLTTSFFKTCLLFVLYLEVYVCRASTTPTRGGEVFTLSKIIKLLTNADCFKLKPEKVIYDTLLYFLMCFLPDSTMSNGFENGSFLFIPWTRVPLPLHSPLQVFYF